jgi:hypothetical protein
MATKTQIEEIHWKTILEAIHARRCVPFLGAAANISSAAHHYVGLPLGGEVALRMVCELLGLNSAKVEELASATLADTLAKSSLYPDLTRTRLQDLPRVSLHYQLKTSTPDLIDLLAKVLTPQGIVPSPLLKALAELPIELIVTTNYDELMERALEAAPKPYERVVQPLAGFDPEAQRKLQDALAKQQGVALYKIHGSLHDKGSAELVISEDDYAQLLSVLHTEAGVPPLIKSRLVDATLLFLGYSLEDWDFRTLFHGLIERLPPRRRRRSFALQKSPPAFWVELWASKGVTIYDVDIYDFAEELRARYAQFAANQPASQGGPNP